MESVCRPENRCIFDRASCRGIFALFTFDEEIDNPTYFEVPSKEKMDSDVIFNSSTSKHLFIQHPVKRCAHFPSFL